MRVKCLAIGLVTVLAGPAGAHGRTVLDPDDSPGPLDVVAARVKHPEGLLKLRLVTYETWDDATISDDLKFVSFELDDPSRPGIERCVVVRNVVDEEGNVTSWEGPVYGDCGGPVPYHREVGTVIRIARIDGHSIEVYVDLDVIWPRRRPESFRWRALTSYEDDSWEGCEPPQQLPPEHFFGTCTDWTGWNTHTRRA